MRHISFALLTLMAVACIVSLGGCATRPGPSIDVREVAVPVAVPCAADPGPAPAYPDTDAALAAAPDVFTGVQLLKAGRKLRVARESELTAALQGCVAPAKP